MKRYLFTLLILINILCGLAAQTNFVSVPQEMIYLHTDRNIYIAGENLFFAMYLKGNPEQMSRYAYLIIRDQNNSIATEVRLEINNQISYGNIFLSDTLKSGFYQILCYTNLMRNAEDTYFKKEILIANRFDEELSFLTGEVRKTEPAISGKVSSENQTNRGSLIIHPDKEEFNAREKISFSIEKTGMPHDSITSLSVSVSEIIPGVFAEPSISEYFNQGKENSLSNLSKKIQCGYMPEFYGAVLQGKVIPDIQSVTKPARSTNYTLLLSTPDTIPNLQYSTTDSVGSFTLYLNPYYEGKDLIIRTKEQDKASIELDNKISSNQPFISSNAYNIPGIKDYLMRGGKIAQTKRFYNKREPIDTQKVFRPSVIIPAVYNKNYSRINPAEYIELPDFVEISREIVPALRVSKKRENYVSSFPAMRYQTTSDAEPTIFLDGVPIDDVNQIITLGSKDIKYIETLSVVRYYGEISFQGILSVFSKNQVINNMQFKNPAIRYKALLSEPYTKPETFKPENIADHLPDLRQVLLWEPNYVPGENNKLRLECYASDLKGEYRINVQGITSGGNPVNGSAIITIR